MTESIHTFTLSSLFEKWAGAQPESVAALPVAGSHRHYFRLTGAGKTAIGAYGSDLSENRAFFAIGKHLRRQGVNVPEIYKIADDEYYYLMQDFGNVSLYSQLQEQPEADRLLLLRQAVEQLAYLQIKGAEGFDFSPCYPVAAFDRTSLFWDLNYFKYCFLKTIGVEIDEVALEHEFNLFADHLLEADAAFFMYRDFQSRNIMVQDGRLGFIDFQGGRRGPLQYDLVSLLFQAKAALPEKLRETLLQHYLDVIIKFIPLDKGTFIRYYYSFVLFRSLQVLAVYGLRGIVEGKQYFRDSIPLALANIQWLLESGKYEGPEMSYLVEVLKHIHQTKFNVQSPESGIRHSASVLTVQLTSFSYRNGYPTDESDNGGGYVFDCRGLNNPGRVAELRDYTGLDRCIADYLERHSQVESFLHPAFALLSLSIDDYLARGFSHLAVSFGCTGGKHRSVYCTERTAAYLKDKYPTVQVTVTHRELADLKNRTRPPFGATEELL